MTTPWLFRFAKPSLSPSRAFPDSSFYYDEAVDMLRCSDEEGHPLAIESQSSKAPQTKKADIEKGEDAKDSRMWR